MSLLSGSPWWLGLKQAARGLPGGAARILVEMAMAGQLRWLLLTCLAPCLDTSKPGCHYGQRVPTFWDPSAYFGDKNVSTTVLECGNGQSSLPPDPAFLQTWAPLLHKSSGIMGALFFIQDRAGVWHPQRRVHSSKSQQCIEIGVQVHVGAPRAYNGPII